MPVETSAPTAPTRAAKSNLAGEVFARLRDMAIRYELKPGERLNEMELAEKLGVSRTPVREALYRLAQDGFLVESGRGYSRRPLDVKETIDLYEARKAVERECVRLAAERASDDALHELGEFLKSSMKAPSDLPTVQLVEFDEGFHERIARASGNAELLRMLISLNERIRFIRWISMESVGRDNTQSEHRKILAALRARDGDTAVQLIDRHIHRRNDQIVKAITAGLARIYIGDGFSASE
ncbi:GntR family transcriptional regulator [Burkholderia cepacia]|uniref:GntR family transcriptional regulator n=1 Tax=Burkholderia cepacia TaxID=292 RepID=UPI002AB72E45|nr:GntR family transcriptional regulator [Burkholderia cepacia]